MNRFTITYIIFLLIFNTSYAMTLEKLLEEHSEAMGGLEKLQSITSAKVTSRTEVGGMSGTTTTFYKAPDRFRVDTSLPIMSYSQGCIDQDCWMRDLQGLSHSLSGDLKSLMITQIALDRLTYLSPDDFAGNVELLDSMLVVSDYECFQLSVNPNGGSQALLAIDNKKHLVRRIRVVTDMATIFVFPDDYREVQGVMIPFSSVEQTDAGIMAGKSYVTAVELDLPLPDSLFSAEQTLVQSDSTTADSTVIPFEFYRNHIYFDAVIPGQGKHRFIFDSGAAGIGLNSDLLSKMKLERIGAVEARGVGGSDLSEVYRLDSLYVEDLVVPDAAVYAMDLAALEIAGTKRIDGIIGYELLSRYPITIDYENQNLILYHGHITNRETWGSECKLSLDFRLPYIDAQINESIIGRFRLDTGSGSTLDLNSPFVQRNKLLSPDSSDYHPVEAFGIGGGSKGLIGVLPSLELCDYRIDSLLVNYSTTETGVLAGEHTAGNIGSGILRRFRLTFDYRNEAVFFDPVADFDVLHRIRNMAGVGFSTLGDTLIVSDVIEGRAADKLLQLGDRVVSIDGQPAIGMPLKTANALLIGGKHSAVAIEVRRDGETIEAQLILDSLY